MERKQLNIGLFGFGCVGYGLYKILQQTPGLKSEIKKVCVKQREKPRPVSEPIFTYDPKEILDDPGINLIVELIDDADAAFQIVSEALRRGKAVVTANKKMLAEHFDELLVLQKKYKTPLLYEAACCASIPIIRNLEEYYDNDLLESIEGIVNGSTNYILTKTFSGGLSYQEALLEAQKAGYAESDPTLDTGGFDAKYKLLILIAHAFGLVLKPGDIFNVGIDQLGELELRYAREKGWKIKLTAHAFKTGEEGISAFVIPQFISSLHPLYHVDDVFNGVITKTVFSDRQIFIGKGAGAYPTASAVLSDISALSYDYKYEYKKLFQQIGLQSDQSVKLKVFLRYSLKDGDHFTPWFDEIEESYQNHQLGFMIGYLSLENLIKLSQSDKLHSVILIDKVHGAVKDAQNKVLQTHRRRSTYA